MVVLQYPKKNRRLILILGFLLLDSHSEEYSLSIPFENEQIYDNRTKPLPLESESILWLVDRSTGDCLSSHGFGQCGDVNLWKTNIHPSSGMIRFESILNHATNGEHSETCLGRSEALFRPYSYKTQRCQHKWKFDDDSGRLYSKSKFRKPHCIIREHSNQNDYLILPCDQGFTSFYPLVLERHHQGQHEQLLRDDSYSFSGPVIPSESLELEEPLSSGMWRDPETGLQLPRCLKLDENSPEQLLMGANVFIKTVVMDFKVYTVAWYIEPVAAATDPTLTPFAGLTSTELAASPAFYKAMVSRTAEYDRSLFVKLAMALNTADVLKGLTEELGLQPANSAAFTSLLKSYPDTKCPRGMEIIFTWRAFDAARNFKDSLEVRMNGKLYASITLSGLAHDFFSKFVNDVPVSPQAKRSYCDGFPTVLKSVPTAKPTAAPSALNFTTSNFNNTSSSPASAAKRNRSFQTYLRNVLIRRRKATFFEIMGFFCIVFNFLILLMTSLPPARSFVRTQSIRARSMISRGISTVRRRIRFTLRRCASDTGLPMRRRRSQVSLAQQLDVRVKKSLSNSCVVALKQFS